MDANDTESLLRSSGRHKGELAPETFKWLAQLPGGHNLKAIGKKFPRILNRIALLWPKPIQCEKYLVELIFDTREGARQGFPPDVAFELGYLKALVSDIIKKRQMAINPNSVNIWKGTTS